jgi:ATP-dependent DNA helicase RecQ
MNTPLEILKKYWNYTEFRGPQEEIILSVLKKQHSVVLLPTGGGKSLCYQIPTLLREGICIVISPLVALIQDQVSSLKEKNIKAIALTSQLTQEESIIAFDNLQFGDFKFLYLSPEKLQSSFIQEKIKQLNVAIIAIDEAHCISEWGHDFRPSFLQIKILKELQPNATFMALTATATQKVIEDICFHLELTNARRFKQSFYRSNLIYKVISSEDTNGKLIQILTKNSDSAIIYVNNRKQTREVAQFLQRNNFKSSYYHGGLTTSKKSEAYTRWISDETPIMVATNAFGMGIDKSNVRVVIHLNTPNSLENYIQESGRAGRDNIISYSIVLTNKSTILDAIARFKSNTASLKVIKQVYHHLNQYFAISIGEFPTTSYNFSLQEFCYTYKLKILQTYNAIKVLEREGILYLDENYNKKSTLKFSISSSEVFKYIKVHPSSNSLLKLILRSYGGIFEHDTIINEYIIGKKLNTSKNEVIKQLKHLHTHGIVEFKYENSTSKILFLKVRDDGFTMHSISHNIEKQNKIKYNKLRAAIAYIKNTKVCRNIQLLSYFNEENILPCGICDICSSKKPAKISVKNISEHILKLLGDQSLNSQEITSQLNFPEDKILITLKLLLEKNKITITSHNKFKLPIS